MNHQTTPQVDSTNAQDTHSPCLISKLPKEVLLNVFEYLRQEPRSPRCINASRNRDLYHVSLVCRQWNNLAAHICYQSVQFHKVRGVFRFRRVLQDSPHIRKIVRELVLPARLGRKCPSELLDAFEEMTNLVDDLSTLTITIRCIEEKRPLDSGGETSDFVHVVPIEEGRHGNLRSLTIFGDGTTPAKFPVCLTARFVHLTSLVFQGVYLSEPVLADTIPALPNLSHFASVLGNSSMMMDDWLLSCPKLEQLQVAGRQPSSFSPSTDDAPMKLLTQCNLTYLCLSSLGENRIGKWLASCHSLRGLLLDWSVFSNGDPGMFPPFLDNLWIEISPEEVVSLDPFRQNFGENPIAY
ncbi:hypothetical protein FRC17_000629, partial [Serendipita sp. 399]